MLENSGLCDMKEGRRVNGVGLWVDTQLAMDRNARKVIDDGSVTDVYAHIDSR